jgi:DNA-binding NarL/FixJ family response regulator
MPRPKRRRIRILLVDDHPVVREGLRSILASFDEIVIAGEASSGQEAIDASRELTPDVVVMDISMPNIGGIEATARLGREMPECKVLALSMHDNRSYITEALRAGARGYLLKDTAPTELVSAISEVFEGRLSMSPHAANALLAEGFNRRRSEALTPREVEVLRFIARGLTNKEIGVQLDLSVRTIETHRENLIRKTGRATVAELTRYAVLQGYVDLHSTA